VQLDLAGPMMKIFGSFSLYRDAQYFNGYGDSLPEDNQRSEVFRAGFSIYRSATQH
jgi:outer membrane phospholipase A